MPSLEGIGSGNPAIIPDAIKPNGDGKPNPQTPSLKSPLDNPVVKAIIGARQEYDRSWVIKHITNKTTKAFMKALGEYDPHGDPFFQYKAALHFFIEIVHLRKVEGNPAPTLLKAEGAEWQRFLTECDKAGVTLDVS